MDALVALAWRAYPAAALMAMGVTIMVWSVGRGLTAARRAGRDPARALALLCGFRGGIVGLALAGIGAAWCWHVGWLLALSLIIGGEELLESSVVIAALRHGAGGTNAASVRWEAISSQ